MKTLVLATLLLVIAGCSGDPRPEDQPSAVEDAVLLDGDLSVENEPCGFEGCRLPRRVYAKRSCEQDNNPDCIGGTWWAWLKCCVQTRPGYNTIEGHNWSERCTLNQVAVGSCIPGPY